MLILSDYLTPEQTFILKKVKFIVTGTHETSSGWKVDIKNVKNKKQSTMAYDELCLILKNNKQ